MTLAVIKKLIAEERARCDILGFIKGTPRTYGLRRNDDIWRICIRDGDWTGIDIHAIPISEPVFVTFSFRINPQSKLYGPQIFPNGRDIDTMVIGALGGLVTSSTRPTIGLLSRGTTIWGYAATKELVPNDDLTGVDITVSLRAPSTLADFRIGLPRSDLSITVAQGNSRKLMAKAAVETQNTTHRVFPACSPICMVIAFNSSGRERNVTSADHIEALVDGMGAATAGDRRLFDAPAGTYSKERYGFDDSCVFGLMVGRFDLARDIDAVVDIYDERSQSL
jgi:hypothetical protein